jgi:hypothetical protein
MEGSSLKHVLLSDPSNDFSPGGVYITDTFEQMLREKLGKEFFAEIGED